MTPDVRGITRLTLALALGSLLVACSGSAPSSAASPAPASELPDPTVEALSDVRYTCGTFPFDPAVLEREGNAEEGDDPVAVAIRAHLATPGLDFDTLPDTGWLLVGADAQRAELIARNRGGSLMRIGLENNAQGWKVTGWGDCRPSLALPPGIGEADWMLDPEKPFPDASTQTFTALVTERSCASGQSSAGRVVGPAILFEPDRVLVAFGVRPPPGGGAQSCQGNPSTPAVVDLGEPLGDRMLIDAGHLPYEDVRTVEPRF